MLVTKEEKADRFAAKLRGLRGERDVTQKDLAEAIESSEQSIVNWESGNGLPSLEKAWRLADYFGVPLDQIAGRDFLEPEPSGKKAGAGVEAAVI